MGKPIDRQPKRPIASVALVSTKRNIENRIAENEKLWTQQLVNFENDSKKIEQTQSES